LKIGDILPREYKNTDVTIESNFCSEPDAEHAYFTVMYELWTPAGESIEVLIQTRDRNVYDAFASKQTYEVNRQALNQAS
jgi:hypothetical protein